MSSRASLAYVVNTLNPGGTERLVMEMSLSFAKEFDLRVFCLDEPGLWAERLRASGIPVHCLWRQPGLDLGVAVALAELFRRYDVRIVHAHQCTPWFYTAIARLIHREPRLLLEEHGRFFPEPDKPLRRLVNRLLIAPLTHGFVAVSEDIRARLQRFEGIEAGRIAVIHNGTVAQPLLGEAERARLRRDLGFEANDFVVGTTGRFDPIKNLPMLVSALGGAAAQEGRIRGLLVGSGPELGHVAALVGEAGLGERVRLTGYRDDAPKLVQCMDLFVLSSLSEGTSMALLEAMAAGVAVVVTAVGGNPEIVVAGESGWVVPSGDTNRLTEAILEAARSREKREGVARAGRARFEARFTFERMIEAYRRTYQELLA